MSILVEPGKNHNTTIVVIKTYISFSVEAEDGGNTRWARDSCVSNFAWRGRRAWAQAFPGESRGARGVFAVRVKTD